MPPIRFERRDIDPDNHCEAASCVDVDRDGIPDIVCGEFWYPGPDFDERCPVAPLELIENEYFDFFSAIPFDLNGDGFPDIITGGWWGKALRWLENPAGDRHRSWIAHPLAEVGNIETTRVWDVDGDGFPEIVPNTPGGPLCVFKIEQTGSEPVFRRCEIYPGPSGHGMGLGDVNGDGRPDFILSNGWLECPASPWSDPWIFHPEFDLGAASVPIIVADVDGDGLPDIIAGQAHGYGLSWWKQEIHCNGSRTWIEHPIDPFNSQYHDLRWVDIDGDGACELVTGKRFRAHCGRDPGSADPIGIYYFKWTGENFSKQVIEYGLPPRGAGCGICFDVADVDGDGRLDLVAPGKDGLQLFLNRGVAANSA